ncbi:MAG TPA: hypothetical protein VF503_09580 [Sphingobium sp.]|uniref:hypothetical protein n=1 Tax=Sphingobium sp. TaxID=1912891 RepID=UPI002ED1126A
MTEIEPEAAPELTPIDPESQARAARQRFFVISLFRLSGALILVFGIAIAQQHFGWVSGQKARIMGMIVVIVGFFQMMVIPRILLGAFATPKQK